MSPSSMGLNAESRAKKEVTDRPQHKNYLTLGFGLVNLWQISCTVVFTVGEKDIFAS